MKTHQKLHNISSYITNQLKLLFVTGILLLPSVAWLLTKPVIASAATPDSCFEFDGGTITDYYDYEGDDDQNPACPRDVDIPGTINGTSVTTIEDQAFAEKGLSSVIIPNSVITIGSAAFVMNQLTSVNIPNSVTEISDAAFDRNQLTSLTLGNSITSIGSIAFIGNNLTSVIIPDSVITIEPMAFAVNSSYANGSMGMFSDPGQAQVLYDAIRLVKLYTEDPSNPNNLQDDTVTEAELLGGQDFNQNGNTDDILGGHVINPPVEESGSNQAELTSPVSSQPVLLTTPTGTNLVSTTASKESSLSVTDPAYDYPSGLVGFTFTTAETDNQVSLTFVTDKTPSQVVPRKYNPTTNAYFNIPNASITETTYNNQHALQLTYTITDNGDLDLDPTIGTITDPVGLATITTDSPNTGISHWLLAVKQ